MLLATGSGSRSIWNCDTMTWMTCATSTASVQFVPLNSLGRSVKLDSRCEVVRFAVGRFKRRDRGQGKLKASSSHKGQLSKPEASRVLIIRILLFFCLLHG